MLGSRVHFQTRKPIATAAKTKARVNMCQGLTSRDIESDVRSGCGLPPVLGPASGRLFCFFFFTWTESDRGDSRPEKSGSWKVVAGEGIEPPTRGFSVLCSTN